MDTLDSPNGALSPLPLLPPAEQQRFRRVFNARAMRQIIDIECDPQHVLAPVVDKARLAGLDPRYYRWLLLQAPFLIEQRKRVNDLFKLGEGGPKLVLYKKALDGQPWAVALYCKAAGILNPQAEESSAASVKHLYDWLNGSTDALPSPDAETNAPGAPPAEHTPVTRPDPADEEETDHGFPEAEDPGELPEAPGGAV